MDQHEIDANEAIAINAINRRLAAVSRSNWGLIDVGAKHIIVHALGQVVADKVSPAYAEQANVDVGEQEPNEVVGEVLTVFNREKSAA